jgi:regulator-associated protein of mTOR
MYIFSYTQMKTVSVALVLCLNVGVDPPDIIKTQPCARLECWIGNVY